MDLLLFCLCQVRSLCIQFHINALLPQEIIAKALERLKGENKMSFSPSSAMTCL